MKPELVALAMGNLYTKDTPGYGLTRAMREANGTAGAKSPEPCTAASAAATPAEEPPAETPPDPPAKKPAAREPVLQ